MKKLGLPILGFSILVIACFAQTNGSLATVKRIYVGSMGQSDEAERFKLLLADELEKAGFATTDDAKTADAVLTGVLSLRVYSDESLARVTAVLKTPDGARLWGRDFEPHASFHRSDTVKLRAQDVAKTLQKDIRKAGK